MSGAPPTLHLQLLRAPSLTGKLGAVYTLERKDAALLAMLATEGPCPPARAAGLLWPDTEPVRARTKLRQRLHRLRKLTGGDVVISARDRLALPDMDAAQRAPPLLRHTGGNPLFLLETLMAVRRGSARRRVLRLPESGDGLPAPQRAGRLIERRLELLTPAALKLARLAAVAGQDFSVSLAAQVLGLHALDIADSWRELEAAHVISGGAFAHDLILEGTLARFPRSLPACDREDPDSPGTGSPTAAQGAGASASAASSGLSRSRRPRSRRAVRTIPPSTETEGSGPGVWAVLGVT